MPSGLFAPRPPTPEEEEELALALLSGQRLCDWCDRPHPVSNLIDVANTTHRIETPSGTTYYDWMLCPSCHRMWLDG